MFVVTLTYIKPIEEVDVFLDGHVAWLKKNFADGLFIASGRRVPRTGGVILARSGDEAAVRAAVAADPFAINGVAKADIVEFIATSSAPELEAIKGI